MVSFTAGATTTGPEQKQKTEFVKDFDIGAKAVSVVNDCFILSVTADKQSKTEFKVKSFETIRPVTYEAKNDDDVGWRVSSLSYNRSLKNSLPEKNRIPIAGFYNKERVKIRCDC